MPFILVSAPGLACYDLWTGSANNTPPAGWQDPAFDDHAWPLAVAADLHGDTVAAGTTGIWAQTEPRSQTQSVLFRAHFTLPAGLVSATLAVGVDNTLDAVYINGVWVPLSNSATYGVPIAAFIAGGLNTLAIQGSNADIGGLGAAYIWFQLIVNTIDDTDTTAGSDVANSGSYGTALGTALGAAAAVRLKHATGVLDWEHDGTLWRVRTGGKTVLQTPFPAAIGQPQVILGRDPTTGLPMWFGSDQSAPSVPPSPPPVSHTYSQPDRSLQDTAAAPNPLPVPPNAQRVCGAAEAMAKLACVIYDAIVQVINKAKSDILGDFSQGLKSEISAELVSLLTEAEFAQWAIDAVQLALIILEQIVETLLNWGTSLPLIWPPNTLGHAISQQYLFMRCAAWQALWLTGGNYLSRASSADGLGTQDYWTQYLAPQWSFFAGSTQSGISQTSPPWQLVWINAIIDRVAERGWAFAAARGAEEPSTNCTGCTGYPP